MRFLKMPAISFALVNDYELKISPFSFIKIEECYGITRIEPVVMMARPLAEVPEEVGDMML